MANEAVLRCAGRLLRILGSVVGFDCRPGVTAGCKQGHRHLRARSYGTDACTEYGLQAMPRPEPHSGTNQCHEIDLDVCSALHL